MNTKHTPGPWNLHKYYNGDPLAVDGGDDAESFVSWTYCVAKGELVLADVVGYSHGRSSGRGFGRADKRSEVEANARRIVECVNACEGIADPSAVPELLRLLSRVTKWADAASRDRYEGSVLDIDINEAFAAIAKATGETI